MSKRRNTSGLMKGKRDPRYKPEEMAQKLNMEVEQGPENFFPPNIQPTESFVDVDGKKVNSFLDGAYWNHGNHILEVF